MSWMASCISYPDLISVVVIIIIVSITIFVDVATNISLSINSNISGITGFTEDDSRSVVNFMKLAVDLATSGNEWVTIFKLFLLLIDELPLFSFQYVIKRELI